MVQSIVTEWWDSKEHKFLHGQHLAYTEVDEPTNKCISLIGSKGQLLPGLLQFLYLAHSWFQALSIVGSQYHAIHQTIVAQVQTTSHFSIKKIICKLDVDEFVTSFVSTNEIIDGFICDTLFSSDAMKYAFEVWYFYFFPCVHNSKLNLLLSVFHKVWYSVCCQVILSFRWPRLWEQFLEGANHLYKWPEALHAIGAQLPHHWTIVSFSLLLAC